MNNTTTTNEHLTTMAAAGCAAASTVRGLADGSADQPTSNYSVPEDPFRDWWGSEHPSFAPDGRQHILMDAVAKALDAGLFYNVDVNAHVAATLAVPPHALAKNTIRTEGGNFGSDVYCARRAVEAQRKYAQQRQVASELKLAVGDKLGTLVFSDYKRNTGATVQEVSHDGVVMTIVAKRGRVGASIKPCPLQLKHAIARAHELGHRKDSYAEFIAARQKPTHAPGTQAEERTGNDQAPLTKKELAQLLADVQDLRGAAARKGTTLDRYEEARERAAARDHFGLGAWLFYYSKRVGRRDGLKDRIDCLRRLFEAGIYRPGYQFFTVFDFGERTFDTCVEMGDSDEVLDGLREIAHATGSRNLIKGFEYMGWSLERRQIPLF